MPRYRITAVRVIDASTADAAVAEFLARPFANVEQASASQLIDLTTAQAQLPLQVVTEKGEQPNGQAFSSEPKDEQQEQGPAPVCAVHSHTMTWQKGKRGFFWSCHKKMEDGSWCSYRPQAQA
jgi:hypothetical protein